MPVHVLVFVNTGHPYLNGRSRTGRVNLKKLWHISDKIHGYEYLYSMRKNK